MIWNLGAILLKYYFSADSMRPRSSRSLNSVYPRRVDSKGVAHSRRRLEAPRFHHFATDSLTKRRRTKRGICGADHIAFGRRHAIQPASQTSSSARRIEFSDDSDNGPCWGLLDPKPSCFECGIWPLNTSFPLISRYRNAPWARQVCLFELPSLSYSELLSIWECLRRGH